MDINVNVVHRHHDDALPLLRAILIQGALMADDLSLLQAEVASLKSDVTTFRAEASEASATLAGLAQRIIDLVNAPDQQAAIDALVAEAAAIRADLASGRSELVAAEDAADEQLPPITV